ncbi:MAG: hypothetical protein QM733_19945 [Ilumatobacteraceae bacterium]
MLFEVAPEPQGEGDRQVPDRAVVHRRLAFAQVCHKQVADRPALQPILIDQRRGVALADMLSSSARGRGVGEAADGLKSQGLKDANRAVTGAKIM